MKYSIYTVHNRIVQIWNRTTNSHVIHDNIWGLMNKKRDVKVTVLLFK